MPLRLSKHRVLLDGIPLNESQSTSLPSASTLDIWSVSGNIVPISGTATISGFTPAPQAGTRRILLCTGTPTFTHSTNLLLPGSADYTATAGDRIEVLAVTTTQFRLSLLQTSVLHFATKSLFPATGVGSTLYLDKSTGLIWRWDTGTSSYVGAPFPIDADGNLVANVNHRSDTLATLLGITNAGNGEIAVATDIDAIVVYRGSPSTGTAYGRSTEVGYSYFLGEFVSIANATTTKLPFRTTDQVHSSAYFLGLFDATNDWFTAPAADKANYMQINALLVYTAALTSGTHKIVLQYDTSAAGDGTAWADVPFAYQTHPAAASPMLPLFRVLKIIFPGKKHRFVAYQDSGAGLFSIDAVYDIRWLKR